MKFMFCLYNVQVPGDRKVGDQMPEGLALSVLPYFAQNAPRAADVNISCVSDSQFHNVGGFALTADSAIAIT